MQSAAIRLSAFVRAELTERLLNADLDKAIGEPDKKFLEYDNYTFNIRAISDYCAD